jgi:hypothetical protein
MIQTSVISDTDDLGLTRLTETYAFQTSEFQTFRQLFKNLTPHSDVMNYVYPTPSVKYSYVVVDSVSISQEAGGISLATVQYVGILRTAIGINEPLNWLPPAKQRLQPIDTKENGVSVVVDFIYYAQYGNPDLELIKNYGTGTSLPSSMNGLTLYRSVKAPYTWEVNPPAENQERYISREGSNNESSLNSSYTYYGMLCVSQFSERVGLFLRVTNIYQDCSLSITPSGLVITGILPKNF